jgi:hypothetical protein
LTLHPGGQAPAPLNFVQRQFTSDNQERTYFILGLLASLIGAIVAVLARRRTQSRTSAELALLDQIAEQGRRDPVEATRDLDDFERTQRDRLARGKIQDTQFDILDRRAREVRRDLASAAQHPRTP